jgi:hypothetical protein
MALRRRFPADPNAQPYDSYEPGGAPGLMRRPTSDGAGYEFHAPQPYQPTDSRTTASDSPLPQPSTPSAAPPPPTAPTVEHPRFVTRDQFDTSNYLKSNPDVDAAMRGGAFNRDPYAHYTQYGWREGRQGAAMAPAASPTAPAAAGATDPAVDRSKWNTDGYQAPTFQPKAAGGAMAGWDQEKWANTNHQTPKYGVGRILSNYAPTVEGLAQALPEIQRAYPGVTFDGKDKLMIPGVGTIDVLVGASQGGREWAWQDMPERGVSPYEPPMSTGTPIEQPSVRNSVLEMLEADGRKPLRTRQYLGREA